MLAGLLLAVLATHLASGQRLATDTQPQRRSAEDGVAVLYQQLGVIETKVNRLIQSQGGRYQFLIGSNGEFVRLDSQSGQIAVFDLTSGAKWFTLEIPEERVRPGNAYYERFVQMIDQLDFNTN